MKTQLKRFLLIGFLVFLNIVFFDKIKSEKWLLIRGPLLSGLVISLAITIPELDLSKITLFFKSVLIKLRII